MADPTIQTFCCHNRIRSPPAVKLMDEFNTDGYIVVCIVSSFFGIAGAIYQIWIRNEATPSQPVFPRRRHGTTSGPSSINTTSPGGSAHSTGRSIIVWLAVADLCASLGVFLRSALWKYISNVIPPDSDSDDTTNVIFCAVSSAWIQYFYMCTWLWTLCYAINVRRTLSGYGVRLRTYHAYVWSISALLTAVGLSVLYIPDADCHNVHDVASAYLRILPNYLMTYGPMVTVMVANPVLYVSASKEVDRQLVARYSQMTSTERDLMTKFKMKFSLINFVYYLCWLPNLLNGVIIWTMWFALPFRTIVTIWYIMAITNPLQAFFNALVYQRWNCTWRIRLEPEESQAAENRRRNRGSLGPSEVTPLLQSQVFQGGASSRSAVHSSTVRLMQDADVDLIPKPTRSINSCTLV